MTAINLSVSLGYVAQLTMLIAHYLGLKLPCEIQLPTRNAPHATIRSVITSRPRPLHIATPLSALPASDPQYAMFIEGVCMLAYNIAWICWSQGVQEAAQNVEDMWQPGKNLFRLLLCTPTKNNPAVADMDETTQGGLRTKPQSTNPMFGRINHECARTFLNNAQGTYYMNKLKINLHTFIDRTKFTLLGDSSAAEWDLVEDEGGRDDDPGAQFVSEPKAATPNEATQSGSKRVMSPTPSKSSVATPALVNVNGTNGGVASKRSATNGGTDVSGGWTKLIPR